MEFGLGRGALPGKKCICYNVIGKFSRWSPEVLSGLKIKVFLVFIQPDHRIHCLWAAVALNHFGWFFRTALILGCEYGCKDAVEVLLKSGADVKAVDSLGHDAFHYARLSKNTELVALVKTHLDKITRGQSHNI